MENYIGKVEDKSVPGLRKLVFTDRPKRLMDDGIEKNFKRIEAIESKQF